MNTLATAIPATFSAPSVRKELPGISSATEERALKFLGEGHTLEVTAAACGVTVSRISQLLAQDEFSNKVAELRYASLLKRAHRTDSYEEIEDTLLRKLKESLALIFDPMKLARLLQVISSSKPKSTILPSDLPQTQNVVALSMPTLIVNKFTTNLDNQVVEIHSDSTPNAPQTLVTIQSSALDRLSKRAQEQRILNLPADFDYEHSPASSATSAT